MWRVRWLEKGKRRGKCFDTKGQAEVWMRSQKQLLENMNKEQLALWNSISGPERTAILVAREVIAGLAKEGRTIPWAMVVNGFMDHKRFESTVPSVAAAIEEFIEWKEKQMQKEKLQKAHFTILKSCLRKISRAFGELSMASITWREIEVWMDDEEWARKTFNDYHGHISQVFERVRIDHPTLSNVMKRIDRYKLKQDDAPVPAPSIVKKALLAAIAKKEYSLLAGLLCGFGLGIRNAEIGKMLWDHCIGRRRFILFSRKPAEASAHDRGTQSKKRSWAGSSSFCPRNDS